MKDLDKIKEAQAREDRRAESIARGEAQLLIGRGPADRALLLAAVPDMIREIDERGAEIVKARNERDAKSNDIIRMSVVVANLTRENERLKAERLRLRAGIDAAREHIDADRIATAHAALGAL